MVEISVFQNSKFSSEPISLQVEPVTVLQEQLMVKLPYFGKYSSLVILLS
jgi:hypothetical protein